MGGCVMPYSNVTPPALPDFSPVTGYSYNGVELPDITTIWTDHEKFPYVFIQYSESNNACFLYVSDDPMYYSGGYVAIRPEYYIYVYEMAKPDNGWRQSSHQTGTAQGRVENEYNGNLLWANHDIIQTQSGGVQNVIVAASEPVPIQSYPYYVLVFDYVKGAEDWYQVHLYYSGTPYTYDGTHVTNAEGIIRKDVYDGSAWSGEITSESAPTLAPGMNGDVYQRIYTNHDILDGEGNVWLAADSVTPVEEETGSGFDLKSFLTGLALGLSGKPLPLAPKEPTAYSYNGVVLPKLPEWDRETYPYAVIVHNTSENKYTLYLSKVAPTYGVYNTTANVYGIYLSGDSELSSIASSDSWGAFMGSNIKCVTIISTRYALWTNADIVSEDGSVYLGASKPVPVFE